MTYTATGTPADGAGLQSAEVRAEFLLIQDETDKLPTVAGNGGKLVAVNAGGTAMEAIATTGTGDGVRATSPTLVTPILGTPQSGVTDNLTTTTTVAAIADTDFVDTNLAAGGKRKILWTAVKTYLGTTFAALAGSASQAFSMTTAAANTNSTQGATTAYADRLTAGTLSGAFTTLSVNYGGYEGTGEAFSIGADLGNLSTKTNSVAKFGVIVSPHYLNTEQKVIVVSAYNNSTNNTLEYGGGLSAYNATTTHRFYTASDNITLLGTQRVEINNIGLAVTGAFSATTTIKTGGYTVATLPAGITGDRAYVTDATAPTYLGALTGGGAIVCPVFKNASAWVSA